MAERVWGLKRSGTVTSHGPMYPMSVPLIIVCRDRKNGPSRVCKFNISFEIFIQRYSSNTPLIATNTVRNIS